MFHGGFNLIVIGHQHIRGIWRYFRTYWSRKRVYVGCPLRMLKLQLFQIDWNLPRNRTSYDIVDLHPLPDNDLKTRSIYALNVFFFTKFLHEYFHPSNHFVVFFFEQIYSLSGSVNVVDDAGAGVVQGIGRSATTENRSNIWSFLENKEIQIKIKRHD